MADEARIGWRSGQNCVSICEHSILGTARGGEAEDAAGSSPVTSTKTKNPVVRRDFLFCIIHFSLFNIHHSLCVTGFLMNNE